jgi:hypothetical protein
MFRSLCFSEPSYLVDNAQRMKSTAEWERSAACMASNDASASRQVDRHSLFPLRRWHWVMNATGIRTYLVISSK